MSGWKKLRERRRVIDAVRAPRDIVDYRGYIPNRYDRFCLKKATVFANASFAWTALYDGRSSHMNP
jgi:hypothetical protein